VGTVYSTLPNTPSSVMGWFLLAHSLGARGISKLLLADRIIVLRSARWVLPQHLSDPSQIPRMETVMLVLKRRPGESIIVNEQMRILVVKTSGGGCQLAFDAPESDQIRRAELPRCEVPDVRPQTSALRVLT
jgi:carbon storage regulator CsrA